MKVYTRFKKIVGEMSASFNYNIANAMYEFLEIGFDTF